MLDVMTVRYYILNAVVLTYRRENVKINDLVLRKVENVDICNWPLGRIVDLFLGNDGIVRILRIISTTSNKKKDFQETNF